MSEKKARGEEGRFKVQIRVDEEVSNMMINKKKKRQVHYLKKEDDVPDESQDYG